MRAYAARMILVTGPTGTIGSQVVAELARAHVPARALVRSPERGARLPDGTEPVIGDLETIDGALEGVESLFLMSPQSPDSMRLEAGAIDAARKAGVKHVVKLASAGASAQSQTRFGRNHGEVIDYLKASGMTSTILMPTDYMSNLLNQADSIRKSATLYAADADAFVASVHPADVGAVGAAALQGGHEGEELLLTGPEAASARDIAAKLGAVLGRDAEIVVLDDDALRNGMLAAGLDEWTVEGLLELYQQYSTGAAADTTGTVEAVLNRPPRSWDDFLRESSGSF
jgi:uncharacterized protein YbjT (DUF2867 family)